MGKIQSKNSVANEWRPINAETPGLLIRKQASAGHDPIDWTTKPVILMREVERYVKTNVGASTKPTETD